MKVGLDTFTIRELKLGAFATLDFVTQHDLAGAQFGGLTFLSPTLDLGQLKEFRAQADRMGLYTHVSVDTCNPHKWTRPVGEHGSTLTRHIELAAACGWHELHSCLGDGPERYEHPTPWTQQLLDSAAFLKGLAPVLRSCGSRIDLETHGDLTTFELVRLIETVGPDIAGICLDTANVLCHAEDPVLAARRAAPYTHLTHTKDAIIYFSPSGYTRQGRPPGEGCLDWPRMLPIFAEHSPDLPLSIEDHKWLFAADIFEERWLALHPDLTSAELAKVVQLAWQCQQKIQAGQLDRPEAYEAIPFGQQMLQRLTSGRDYLKRTLAGAA